MRSFITYPLEFEKILYPQGPENCSGKLVAHYELYKKVRHLEGCLVKCGITAEEGFSRFAMLKNLMLSRANQKMIAFEKDLNNRGQLTLSTHLTNSTTVSGSVINNLQQNLVQRGIKEQVDFVPGNVSEAIPDYLIENPELKICFLNIDLDDYEATLSTLEYFYPRLIEGGVLILDNYFKKEEDYNAVKTYFCPSNVVINNFSVSNGPHYIIKK